MDSRLVEMFLKRLSMLAIVLVIIGCLNIQSHKDLSQEKLASQMVE